MGESRRVALLARPGQACERLRAALQEAGGEIVLEADPSTIEPSALAAARVGVVLVALDPAVEDALEKFDDVLADPAITVLFDEAELAARREGWDAARWVRHLSAKLHRHADVLPPGREPEAEADADAGLGGEIVLEGVDLDGLSLDDVQLEGAQRDDVQLDDVQLEAVSMDADALDVDMDSIALPAPALEMPALDMPADAMSFGEMTFAALPVTEAEAPAMASGFGGIAFTDDVNALDFETEDGLSDLPRPTFRHEPSDAHDFDALMRDLGAGAANERDHGNDVVVEQAPVRAMPAAEALPGLDFDIAPVDAPTARETERAMPDFSSLSLADVSDAPYVATTPKLAEAPVAPKFGNDLQALDAKIASLSLVDEAAAARGAVLILAGIGGPDAVRQILTALPKTFPRPVLISQRLDGGRYDRLVQQMARAASLPVHLAEAATMLEPGHVYIVPPELGLESVNGLRFAANASLLGALPASDSAVFLLSGADPAMVESALAHAAKGALVAGQSPDGCYDAAAPMALTARGGESAAPHDLVNRLLIRWPA